MRLDTILVLSSINMEMVEYFTYIFSVLPNGTIDYFNLIGHGFSVYATVLKIGI